MRVAAVVWGDSGGRAAGVAAESSFEAAVL